MLSALISADLDACYNWAVEILYKELTDSNRVYDLMKAIEVDWYSQEDWQKLYRKLALEAHMFVSESGSEHVLVWILNCTCKVFVYINDPRYHLALLTDCAFLIYNTIFDVKRRYGQAHLTRQIISASIDEFIRQEKFYATIAIQKGLLSQPHCLKALRNLLVLAYSTVNESSQTKINPDELENFFFIDLPNVINAMWMYLKGVVAQNNDEFVDAKKNFYDSLSSVINHFGEYSIEAIYFYNSLYGNWI